MSFWILLCQPYLWVDFERYCSNLSTTPITAMGCQQCLPLIVVQLKGKHYPKKHCRIAVAIRYVRAMGDSKNSFTGYDIATPGILFKFIFRSLFSIITHAVSYSHRDMAQHRKRKLCICTYLRHYQDSSKHKLLLAPLKLATC